MTLKCRENNIWSVLGVVWNYLNVNTSWNGHGGSACLRGSRASGQSPYEASRGQNSCYCNRLDSFSSGNRCSRSTHAVFFFFRLLCRSGRSASSFS